MGESFMDSASSSRSHQDCHSDSHWATVSRQADMWQWWGMRSECWQLACMSGCGVTAGRVRGCGGDRWPHHRLHTRKEGVVLKKKKMKNAKLSSFNQEQDHLKYSLSPLNSCNHTSHLPSICRGSCLSLIIIEEYGVGPHTKEKGLGGWLWVD